MRETRLADRTFSGITDRDSGAVVSEIVIEHCCFEGCVISLTHDVRKRTTVRNVTLRSCKQLGCEICSAVLENVVLDGLDTSGQLLQTWAAAFRHVVLKGRIDRLMISPIVEVLSKDPSLQKRFDEANRQLYETCDWALDIRDIECKELQIGGVPASKILRDPETQVVVTREVAASGGWRSLPFQEQLWPISLNLFLDREEDDDVVLIAGKRHRKFKQYLKDLDMLVEAGIAVR
jgi:hypothetical protein